MSASVFINPACGASLPAPRHLIPVLAADGTPLTPTTPAHARRLLAGRQATKHWTRLGTFAIQLVLATGAYRFYDAVGQRRVTKELAWIHGGYSTMSWCAPQRRTLLSPPP
jgi:RRXRR protein